MNVRRVGPADHLINGIPVFGRTFAVVECRDSTGAHVHVVVPTAAARAVAEILAATSGASGPQWVESRRSNNVVRRLVGPWTIAVLTAAVVGAGVHVALWWGSVDVIGEVVAVTPKASGEGATCTVAWRDPWSGAGTTSDVNCPRTRMVGDSYAAVARPGELAPAVTRQVPALVVALGLVVAVPDWLYRTRLMLRERRARTGAADTR
jgi:hypothetical protein